MKVAIMQPYLLPYVGYFQLIAAVDLFIVYDNIQYTKKGWINRNRICRNGAAATFSLPLKSASDHLNVCERELAADFKRVKLLNQIKGAYERAPFFAHVFPLIERIVRFDENNLFRFLYYSIRATLEFLNIGTEIRISSGIAIDHSLKKHNKVIALCRAVGARTYVNASGGTDLYSRDDFESQGIGLKFIRSKPFEYRQFELTFVPLLSIVDVLMFNSIDEVRNCILNNYELI
jgi:hypothetical protein